MKAIRLARPSPDSFVLEDVPIPKPGEGEALVRVKAAGICGTDRHIWHWDPSIQDSIRPPYTPGHEFCGEIAELGRGVKGWSTGEYVSAEMHVVCGRCVACRTGSAHLCANQRVVGLHRDGTFAEYVVVPASNLVRLPAEVPVRVGAFLDALGNAVHTALSADIPGRSVAVLGYGPIGAMTAAVAQFCGAGAVFVTDVSPFNLAKAREWVGRCETRAGRKLPLHVLDVRGEGRRAAIEAVKSATGGDGCDVVLEISGAAPAINDGLEMLRPGGSMRLLGLTKERSLSIQSYNDHLVFKGVDLKGIYGRRIFETWEQMLAMLRAGLDVEFVVTEERPIDGFLDGMAKFDRGEAMKVVIYPNGTPSPR